MLLVLVLVLVLLPPPPPLLLLLLRLPPSDMGRKGTVGSDTDLAMRETEPGDLPPSPATPANNNMPPPPARSPRLAE